MKTVNACTADEALCFLKMYFATLELLAEAQEKYRRLADVSTDTSLRSKYRALALKSERDFELLNNRRRDFLDNKLAIKPPSLDTVNRSKELATELAKIVAKDAKARVIIELVTEGLDAFNQVTTAT